VANTYLTMLADEELLALTQQTLKTREESLRLTKLRFENGVVSKLDLQQASRWSKARAPRWPSPAPARPGPEPADPAGRPADPGQPAAGATLATTNLPDLPAGMPSDLLASVRTSARPSSS
jgi:multidrug efflux system outer membrane protein